MSCGNLASFIGSKYYMNLSTTAVGLRLANRHCTATACNNSVNCRNSFDNACHSCYILQTEKLTRENHSSLCASHGQRARLAWLDNKHILRAIAIAYKPPTPGSIKRDLRKYTHFFTGLEIDPGAKEWIWQYKQDHSGRAFTYRHKGKPNYKLDEIKTDKKMSIHLSVKAKKYLDDVTSIINGVKPHDTKKNQITFNMDVPGHPKLEIVSQDEKWPALCELPLPRCIEAARYNKLKCPIITSTSLPTSTRRTTNGQPLPATTQPGKVGKNTLPDQPADSNEHIPIIDYLTNMNPSNLVGGIAGVLLICALFIIVGLAWKMDKVRREMKQNSGDDSAVAVTEQGSPSPLESKQIAK